MTGSQSVGSQSVGSLPAGRAIAAIFVVATVALLARTALNLSELEVPPGLELPAGEALIEGQAAPDFTLATVAGDSLSLASLQGQVVLVDFWATWCGPCVVEMPVLQQLYDDFEGRGVEIVAVSTDVTPAKVPRFVDRHGLTFPVLLGGLSVQALYRVTALPTLYVVDQQGTIRHVHVGYTPGNEVKLIEEVEALLAEG